MGCAISEARFLNRTIILPHELCIAATHSNNGKTLLVNIHELVDVYAVQQDIPLILEPDLPDLIETLAISTKWVVPDIQLNSTFLKNNGKDSSLIIRSWDISPGRPYVYWYEVCDTNEFERVWYLYPSPLIKEVEALIMKTIGNDFVGMHVRRGDKASLVHLWPNVEIDTRPENIMKKLLKWLPENTTIYIASNEKVEGFFRPISEKYKIFSLEDFAEKIRILTNYRSDYNSYIVYQAELNVLKHAKSHIDTFKEENPTYYLTEDPRHGVGVSL